MVIQVSEDARNTLVWIADARYHCLILTDGTSTSIPILFLTLWASLEPARSLNGEAVLMVVSTEP